MLKRFVIDQRSFQEKIESERKEQNYEPSVLGYIELGDTVIQLALIPFRYQLRINAI